MADRLEFDIGFDFKKAEAEVRAFEKRVNPLELKVKLDTKAAKTEAKALEERLGDINVGVKIDFDETQVLRDVERLKEFIEFEAGQIDIKADFDAADLAEEVRAAVAIVQRTAPKIKIRVEVDKDSLGRAEERVGSFAGRAGRSMKDLPSPPLSEFEKLLGGTASEASRAGAQVVGLGNNFAAIGKPGGPVATAAIAVAAFAAAAAATPAAVFVAGGAIASLAGVFAGFGIAAAAEMEPVLNALQGIEGGAVTLKETFAQEMGAIKGILGAAFLPIGKQVAEDLFDPINSGLAQFSASLAPSIGKAVSTLGPALDRVAATFAGPLGASVGRITETFAELVDRILPKLSSTQVIRILDSLEHALSESGDGVEKTVDLLLDLTEVVIKGLPTLIRLGEVILTIADGLVQMGDAARLWIERTTPFLQQISFNNEAKAAEEDTKKVAGAVLDMVNKVHSAAAGDSFKSLGEQAGKAGAKFDELANSLFQFNKKNLEVLPPRIKSVASSIDDLQKAAADGLISFDQLNALLITLRATSGLSTKEFDLAFKAWEAGVKAADEETQKATQAAEQLQTQLTSLNDTINGQTTITDLAVTQQAFFGEALRDAKVSAEEFNAILALTGLSSAQAMSVFSGVASEVAAINSALQATIPTFSSALAELDFAQIQVGRRVENVMGEMRKQLLDSLNFLSDTRVALSRGADDAVRQILTSGASKQIMEAAIHELAVGGAKEVAAIEKSAEDLSKTQVAIGKGWEEVSKLIGVKLPEELNGALPNVKASAEALGKEGVEDPLKAAVGNATSEVDELDKALSALGRKVVTPQVSVTTDPVMARIAALNAALDQLDQRTVTVDILANVLQQGRREGGPVLAGIPVPVNEAGREGVIDASGFRLLPPGPRTMTFDQPGVVIPHEEIQRYWRGVAAPAAGGVAASHVDRSVVNNNQVVVRSQSRDPYVVAKKVLRAMA